MTDKKVESLKKRLRGNGICTWVIGGVVGIVGLANVMTAIQMFADANAAGVVFEESPAFTLGDGIRSILLAVVFVLLALILGEIQKNGKPFTKANCTKLRVMAIITICCAFVPMLVASVAGFFDPNATFQLSLEMNDIFLGIAGAIIGIVSEIFYYGNELQDEMDSIA